MTVDADSHDVEATTAVPAPNERLRSLLATGAAVLIGLLVGAALLTAAGADPAESYLDMVKGTLGSRTSVGLILTELIPLVTVGLGLTVAFRARLWNIGAEGQYVLGGVAGGAAVILIPVSSTAVALPMALCGGIVGGAVWGWIVAALRNRWRVNEIISSLMLNYVAIFGLAYLVRKPLNDPEHFLPQSEAVPDEARLPDLSWLETHSGLIIALALTVGLAYALRRTHFGFRVEMLGLNPDAAAAAGVDTRRMVIRVMLISGGLAGLGGVMQVLGPESRLTNALPSGVGFTAIIVALLGRLRPAGVLLAALFISALTVGGDVIQRTQQVPRAVVLVIQALFVLLMMVADRLRRR